MRTYLSGAHLSGHSMMSGNLTEKKKSSTDSEYHSVILNDLHARFENQNNF